ncbi:hypothetical protein VE23_23180 [Paenibacillus sp. D9]|uniref:hypothetical protein n=1 Tax=Paenibacillus sp. D9 TaxID=665792 RepID=UPI00061F9C28|nr:hypothetical protein [Paenibacillus sp. D9]KKC49317.1 hypothetical protein VE23_23180 [Paenibacillus sp. D9]
MKATWTAAALLLAALALPAAAYAAPQASPAAPQASPHASQDMGAPDRYNHQGDLRNPKGHPHHDRYREARKLAMLKEAAAYFGIKADGKTEEQLRQEIHAAKEKQPEKWTAFKASMKEKRFARMKEFAVKQGIKVEGKSEQQLRDELKSLHEQGKLKVPAPKGPHQMDGTRPS